MDDILNIKDQNNDTILLFMDLSAAFDTVDHAILISRLKTKFGITGTVLKIILSYLTDRVFYVVTDEARSKGRSMKYGVPQGSILGPTLFILYMQDLEMIAREHGLSIHMFADDTQIYIAFKAEQSDLTVPLLETCLMYIKKWMQVNFLKLNEDKTQLLVIPRKYTLNVIELNVQFCGNELESLMEAKNLGVYFDNNVDMGKQIKHICSTGYSALRNLWAIGETLSRELKTITR